MRVRKIGDWAVNRSGPHGSAGYYVEAVDIPQGHARYALADPDYLEEAVSRRLERGEIADIVLESYELAERIDQLELRGWAR